jgi:hypothetical protein
MGLIGLWAVSTHQMAAILFLQSIAILIQIVPSKLDKHQCSILMRIISILESIE